MKTTYKLYNKVTNKLVGKYSTKQMARKARDKKDVQYGSYVHFIKEEIA